MKAYDYGDLVEVVEQLQHGRLSQAETIKRLKELKAKIDFSETLGWSGVHKRFDDVIKAVERDEY
jgi:hypothetical protein